ncbi:isocitrate lyase/phosphoenolpyruvate mutase family protein [Streptomyces sp. NBC_00620]|uniref:isocitrate lyase/phosphoenolpyruvate mutase family protein n=1 Tax=Streptomyces sp. NBC_00620 TaxID=2903666 RepID=UPI0022593271|nr:isocitrate lyase/phosphoenolpyruvate mutase family protein [Streptomyces sp. NBC_00620]MCX4974729.1 isocitrate lyase/phosphoenolpyruvate mutase family protein [Streptomyces sp. NBC_00620]
MGGSFLLPNAWYVGSARVLESAGFPAVATTSAGIAFSLGRPDHDFFDEKAPDGRVDRETMMRRVREIADGVTVPVSADLEDGYGEAPETVATTVSLTLAAGAAGGSIEDFTGDRTRPLYDEALAVDRIRAARAAVLEHVPQTLAEWLGDRRKSTPAGEDVPGYAWVEEALTRGAAFMSSRGLVHFDAHFNNVLTDGRLIYFADFGLALSSRFELSEDEAEFLADHHAYDGCYVVNHLLRHHLPDGLRGEAEHEAFLHDWIAGERPEGVPPAIAAIIDRHARAAAVLDGFHHGLITVSKRTPYPAADIERARPGGRSAG